MPLYESVFIARQDIAAPQVDTLTDNIQKIIEDQGGSIAKREYWGLRSIAHKIKKNRKGHYTLLNIDAPAPAIHEMERQMRINEDVLRYLTIRMDELEEGPSVIMRSRSSDDRPRRPREDFADKAQPAAGSGDAPEAEASVPAVRTETTVPAVVETEEPVVKTAAEAAKEPVVKTSAPAAEAEGDEK